jgi:hypothetical protein
MLRRRADYVLGWIVVVGGLLTAIAAMIWSPRTGTFADPLQFTLIADVLLWFVWVVMHAHVALGDEGIRVVNWYVKCDIPWSQVKEVQARTEVRIVLQNDRTIQPVIGSYSLVSAVRGGSVQARIASAIAEGRARDSGAPATAIRWRPDLHLSFLLLLTVFLVGLNVIIYYLILKWAELM